MYPKKRRGSLWALTWNKKEELAPKPQQTLPCFSLVQIGHVDIPEPIIDKGNKKNMELTFTFNPVPGIPGRQREQVST